MTLREMAERREDCEAFLKDDRTVDGLMALLDRVEQAAFEMAAEAVPCRSGADAIRELAKERAKESR
jgi:hypothetical protein